MARKILQSFRSVIQDAARRALIAHDVAAGTTIARAKRHRRRLEVGVDVPTPSEVKAMIRAGEDSPKALALVCLAGLAGLRASELRGLAWTNIKLGNSPSVTVTTRADRWARLGSPKSESSQRKVPLGSTAVRALKAWKLAQPPIVTKQNGQEKRRPHTLVFGTAKDRPDMLGNLTRRLLAPLEVAAGVTSGPKLDQDGKPILDKRGKPVMLAKYSPHAMRHYAISSWLATIDPKTVQHWAGHATLALTLDTYGHMIPRPDDHQRIAAAESALLG